jgi:hypothetical protein
VPLDPEDTFLHGVIQGQGGTCASLPVVYAAVGRRLGYPLKLVSARAGDHGHLFARWDGDGERLNLEVNETGMGCPTDKDFRTGLFQLTPELERGGDYLRSQTPREELAGFLAQRGHHCWDIGWHREAANAFAWALVLHPEHELLHNNVVQVCNEWGDTLRALQPPGFPRMDVAWPARRFPVPFPKEYERAILGLEGWEKLLNHPAYERDWWEPLRRGQRVAGRPVKVRIVHSQSDCDIAVETFCPSR